MSVGTPFLFDPVEVEKLLDGLAHLREGLDDPAQEGEASAAFPAARKSEREVYRVLSNVHYPQLRALLHNLDTCIARGFIQLGLLRTRSRVQFTSLLSELHVAHHLLSRGFSVEGLDTKRGSDRVPELVARREGFAAAIEVYAPREWEGLSELIDDLKDSVKNLDVCFDYRFEVRVDQLEDVDAQQRILLIRPGKLALALDIERRAQIVAPLIADLASHLRAGGEEVRVVGKEPALNLSVSIAVHDVKPTGEGLPARSGTISPPGLSGYVPEAMFDRIVRRVRAKAARGQAPGSGLASTSVLIVDLAHAQLSSELVHPLYRTVFERTLQHLGDDLSGYDAVAFCESVAWDEQLRLHFFAASHPSKEAVAEHLFGEQRIASQGPSGVL